MEKVCYNHPSRKTISFCHHCGEHYCAECLNEGEEYYYCNKKECYDKFLKQKETAKLLYKNFPYSDVFSRIIALLIDGVVLFIFNSALTILLKLEPKDIVFQFGLEVIFRHPLFYVTGFLYFVLMESSPMQATIGKMIQNLIVTDLGGERISILKAAVRNISKVLSALTLMIGYIMAGFTERKQALHDLIARTLIIKLGKDVLPAVVSCSECNESMKLNVHERILKEYECPNCHNKISFNRI